MSIWKSQSSDWLLSPYLPLEQRKRIEQAILQKSIPASLWLKSSGTESSGEGDKLVCINKASVLFAAQSVNKFFDITSKDHWLNPLPKFHIGGLSVSARCELASATEEDFTEWDADQFWQKLKSSKATLTSLVPTQIYDLVQLNRPAPASLRLVLVGGGALRPSLYSQAVGLGYPIAISYGMTETCALVAAQRLDQLNQPQPSSMTLLPHVQFNKESQGWAIESQALFTGYLWVRASGESTWQPRPEPFILDDDLDVEGDQLRVRARKSELVKILGETLNLFELEEKLQSFLQWPLAVVAREDARRGYSLHLYLEGAANLPMGLEEINQKLLGFERLTTIESVESLPRSELGKIKRSLLR